MLLKATTALAALLVFGTPSAVFADTPNRTASNDRIAAMIDAAKDKGSSPVRSKN